MDLDPASPGPERSLLRRVHAFQDIAPVAAAHNERIDGKGYPYGLKGAEICLEARILTVADVFDALSAERPYRAAMPMQKRSPSLTPTHGTASTRCIAALKSDLPGSTPKSLPDLAPYSNATLPRMSALRVRLAPRHWSPSPFALRLLMVRSARRGWSPASSANDARQHRAVPLSLMST